MGEVVGLHAEVPAVLDGARDADEVVVIVIKDGNFFLRTSTDDMGMVALSLIAANTLLGDIIRD